MKTPEFWTELWSQSGPFDLIDTMTEAKELVEAIQRDAYENPPTYGELLGLPATFPPELSDKEEYEILRNYCNEQEAKIDMWKLLFNQIREKWLDARKHLRAANKGAERNAIALQLAASRINSMNDPLEGRVWQWLTYSDSELRLRMGELTAQEIRNIRACLKAIIGTSKLA